MHTNAHTAANVGQYKNLDLTHGKPQRELRTIKRSNKVLEAMSLPIICNLNPRSVYNKIDEFHEFVNSESIDIVFMSESWERDKLTLKDIIKLNDHIVISNVHQRKEVGGRPALIVNKNKFEIRNLTNTLIPVKWGVEAVWALLTPKNVNQSSKIQHIVCAAIYSKPGSRKKSELLDHISEALNIVNVKYGRGLHFILAGDTNELRLKPILDMSSNLVQIVNKPTRTDKFTGKKAMLDPVIMTMSQYYQEPEILAPLDSDPDKNGTASDHNIVKVKPISTIDNQCARVTRKIVVQPFTESGIRRMTQWLMDEDWQSVADANTADEKGIIFQNILEAKYNEYFPKKTIKVSNDDQPWFTQKLKQLDRQKNRRSDKWKFFYKQFKKEVKRAKADFYKKMVKDLKNKDPNKWYSAVKRMTSYENKSEKTYS